MTRITVLSLTLLALAVFGRYRFRARLPREAGYPFAGRTRTVAVTVRGR